MIKYMCNSCEAQICESMGMADLFRLRQGRTRGRPIAQFNTDAVVQAGVQARYLHCLVLARRIEKDDIGQRGICRTVVRNHGAILLREAHGKLSKSFRIERNAHLLDALHPGLDFTGALFRLVVCKGARGPKDEDIVVHGNLLGLSCLRK
jgi:hypothetical protein